MIGSLKGKVAELFSDHIILEVQEVGYLVFLGSRNLANISKDDQLRLTIHTQVREDDISLYGFLDNADKEIFLALKKVSGVGAKTALNILGVMAASEIIDAISYDDKAAFTRISGIGPKAAARIINDLKDKVAKLGISSEVIDLQSAKPASQASPANDLLRDALSALENLGYQRAQILDLVRDVAKDEQDIGEVISKTLKKLAK